MPSHRSLLLALCVALVVCNSTFAAAPPRPSNGKTFEVQTIKDIAYLADKDADPIKHRLDLYLPKGHKDFPVLFFVHGGTWKSGDKKIYAPLGELFASRGVGVVITNYRLSPKVKHPAHIEDVARAFAWTCDNIGKHGGRTDRLFVSGHSAGGHLVALLATDEQYLKAHSRSFASIRGVLALSGVYTIAPGLFASQFGNDADLCRKASPLTHVNGKHAPFLIVYADKDYPLLGPLAEQLGKSLVKAKCEAEVVQIKGRDHISIMRKMIEGADDPTAQAMLKFLTRHTGTEGPRTKGR